MRAVAVRADVPDGRIIWQSGPPVVTPWRSASKPFQLWTCLDALGDPDLSDADLAIGASSHSGQPFHIGRVRELLERFDVDEGDLRCAPEPPLHAASARELVAAGQAPLPIHSDCSGKHAFMLAASAAQSWDLDYTDRYHPLQQAIAVVAARWAGEDMAWGRDGCGVPTFGLSVAGMALAWARLAAHMAGYENGSRVVPGSRFGEPVDRRAARIGWAMARHPRLTSGDDRLDLALSRACDEAMVGKVGAAGVYCIALPRRGVGIALKSLTGSEDALAMALVEVLAKVAPRCLRDPDALRSGDGWPWAIIRDVAGTPVGTRVVSDT